jgi:uncharacterized protein YndB with AHSA1/START domain
MTQTESIADRIERSVEIAAPVARVWKALTDSAEFGTWFRAAIDGPFVAGRKSLGRMTYPGWEDTVWEAEIVAIEPERYFAFRWPHTGDGGRSKGGEPTTLVEFRLAPAAGGTRVTVCESGFAALPDPLRSKSMRENTLGWELQMENLRAHVGGA